MSFERGIVDDGNPVIEKWTNAKVGERVHIDSLLAYIPMVHFYQPDRAGPSFCETPTSTFKCNLNELPYYTRIE